VRNLTRPIRSLTVVGGRLVVGSDSGALCAFDQQGQRVWGLPASSAVVQTVLVRRAAGDTVLAAACKDGKVFVVSAEGQLLALWEGPGRLVDMIADGSAGDGHDRLLLITSDPNRVWRVAP